MRSSALLLSLVLLACSGGEGDTVTVKPQDDTGTVADDSGGGGGGPEGFDAVWPLLRRDCVDCHDDWGTDADTVFTYLMENESRQGQPFVSPEDPAGSVLYLKVTEDEPPGGDPMPLQLSFVTDEELEGIADWITQGAAFDPAFRGVVMKVYDAYQCDDCHRVEWGMDDPEAVYDAWLNGTTSTGAPLVEPGKPNQSAVYQRMAGTAGARMPIWPDPWAEADVAILRDWILEGAARE